MKQEVKQWVETAADLIAAIKKHPGLGDKMLKVNGNGFFTSEDIRTVVNTLVINEAKGSGGYGGYKSKDSSPKGARKKVSGEIEEKNVESGTKNGKTWKKYSITIEGETYSCFDRKVFAECKVSEGDNVEVTLRKNGDFWNIEKIAKVDDPAWGKSEDEADDEEDEDPKDEEEESE